VFDNILTGLDRCGVHYITRQKGDSFLCIASRNERGQLKKDVLFCDGDPRNGGLLQNFFKVDYDGKSVSSVQFLVKEPSGSLVWKDFFKCVVNPPMDLCINRLTGSIPNDSKIRTHVNTYPQTL
jgi:hypothetical protein